MYLLKSPNTFLNFTFKLEDIKINKLYVFQKKDEFNCERQNNYFNIKNKINKPTDYYRNFFFFIQFLLPQSLIEIFLFIQKSCGSIIKK